jgi:DNA-nicking Smr family endonuclease
MRKPRHVSPDERALWDEIAKRTVPLDPQMPDEKPALIPAQKIVKPPKDPIPDFKIGAHAFEPRSHDVLAPIGQRLSAAPVQMDYKSYSKMTKGKIKPEARIDLHGMTMAQAHPALVSFILNAQTSGKRLLLVITGKGKDRDDGGPIPVRHGVLRHQVPQWLALPPLRSEILQVTPAHIRHGGQGAYYVYLRRIR